MNRLWFLVAIAVAACAADPSAEVDGGIADLAVPSPVDLSDASECVTVVRQAGANQTCVVEWSCLDAGLLVLACGAEDGLACRCGTEKEPGPLADGAPATCGAVDVAEFARSRCGWSWL